jgi:hypothetical protein
MTSLPAPVESALGPLLADLTQRGFVPRLQIFSPESFGNFVVRFGHGFKRFSLTSDRGQFFLEGGWFTAIPLDLRGVFAGPHSIRKPLLAWLDGDVV